TLDGRIWRGRDVDLVGAHCSGYNTNSIGVVYVGGLGASGKADDYKDTRTPEQKEGLRNLLKELRKLYPSAKIRSHKDFANKACPCFNATQEYANI
ncbi:MAG: N-acetylmuramoyl-L-alanine amidase, partial [Bacteroidaceae bacterium]|nr:N-acetylmuramoyl-L-alanine amidase [Bacteroidaceae bacterium]